MKARFHSSKRLTLALMSLGLGIGCSSGGSETVPPAVSGPTNENPPLGAPQNSPPVMQDHRAVVLVGESLELDLTVSDPDGDAVEIEVQSRSPELKLAHSGARVNLVAATSGLHRAVVRPMDRVQKGDSKVIEIFAIEPQAERHFWIRSEDIQSSAAIEEVSGAAPLLTDWKDRISGKSPQFPNSARTPRVRSNFQSRFKAADFEFTTGAQTTNDLMWYPSTFVFSAGGHLNVFAVAKNKGFGSTIAPVVSQGIWLNRGWGLNWNSTQAGIGSATDFGGRDDRLMMSSITGVAALLSGQIRPASSGGALDGVQRIRFNSTEWTQGTVGHSLTRLTRSEVSAVHAPTPNGSPIMIGANNRHATQPDRRFVGEVAEVLVIADELSDDEVKVIELALKQKYGL